MEITHHWPAYPGVHQEKQNSLSKRKEILAGIRVAREFFAAIDKDLKLDILIEDGSSGMFREILHSYLSGNQQSILKSERLVLNIMQRMSGIATSTHEYANQLKGLKTKILDTRKTTPD